MTENEEPENRRSEINKGNYNERIERDYVGGNYYKIAFNFRRQNKNYAQIRQKLLEIVTKRLESLIDSSLNNRVYIILEMDRNPEQIEAPFLAEVKVNFQRKIHLDNTEIINIFDQSEVAGRLLILGQPGAGKTTMLYKLAEKLVKRAYDNSNHPIPVLFSLSNWKNDSQSIKDWLVNELKDKYGMRKDIGKELVDNQEIIPLLDGLDELAVKRQENCVIKINEFLQPGNWTNSIVVCSRIQEYERYKALLQLNNSIELYPLSQDQIYQYLQNTGHLQLWDSITHDADLSQLAKTPLLLNIIVLSAQEMSIQTWQQFKSSEERLSYLFDAYIQKMLKRYYQGKQPNKENTQRWLNWLAQRLIEESATEFLIERIQPYWLKKKLQKVVYNLIVWGVIVGLIGGLIGGLIEGLSCDYLCYNSVFFHYYINFETYDPLKNKDLLNEFLYGILFRFFRLISYLFIGLIIGLFSGLIGGLLNGLIGEIIEDKITLRIVLVNRLFFFKKEIIKWLIIGIIVGLFLSLTVGLVNLNLTIVLGSLIIGPIFGFFPGFILGFIGDKIEIVGTLKVSLDKFINGLKIGLGLGLIIGLIVGLLILIVGMVSAFSERPIIGIFSGLVIGLFVVINIYKFKKFENLINSHLKIINMLICILTFMLISLLISNIISDLISGIISGLILGIISGLILGIISGLILGIISGLILGIISGLILGIDGAEIEKTDIPNQGISQSVINTVILSLLIFLFTLLLTFTIKIIYQNLEDKMDVAQVLISSLESGLFFGILVGIFRSGTLVIKHFVLRIILWSSGYAPWNYAEFLNYCTNRLFLQRVGGSYRFIHDLLRQHFAKSYSQNIHFTTCSRNCSRNPSSNSNSH